MNVRGTKRSRLEVRFRRTRLGPGARLVRHFHDNVKAESVGQVGVRSGVEPDGSRPGPAGKWPRGPRDAGAMQRPSVQSRVVRDGVVGEDRRDDDVEDDQDHDRYPSLAHERTEADADHEPDADLGSSQRPANHIPIHNTAPLRIGPFPHEHTDRGEQPFR